jgi:UDP-N-acetylmuramoyl-tripeptide--D-alanyl-D-alanine ligase
MSGIDEYLQRIQHLINELPFKLSATINIENRSNVVLYIKGKITFTDDSELHFKEYLITSQWKKAILNFLLIPEITVLIVAILFFLGKVSSPTIYYSLTFLLQFENLYVFYKIFSLKFHIPKKTWRLIILSSLIILNLFFIFFWLYFNKVYIYLILPFFLVCFPCLVLLVNSLTQPIFDFKKKQIFHQATKKIKQQKIHTIWITWSFGKSSTKEYLTHILVKKYKVFKTPKNINTELGIANLILKTDFSKYNFFIAEMWAYSKWEIKQSWKIINHKDAFVSGIWNQHIWLFGNQQNIIDGKLEIGEEKRQAAKDTLIESPKDIVHCWYNNSSQPLKFMVIKAPKPAKKTVFLSD